MKVLKFKIGYLLSLFLLFACSEIDFVQPQPEQNQQPQAEEPTTTEYSYQLNDFPLFYLDFEVQGDGTANAVGAPVLGFGDLRATSEVPWYFIQNDTTLSLSPSLDGILSELSGIKDIIKAIQYSTTIQNVTIRAVGLNDANISGQVTEFYIRMWAEGYGMVETGYRGSSRINYNLKENYVADVNSSDPNAQGILEIFDRSILAMMARQSVHYSVKAWTNVNYGTKLRYYFTVNGWLNFSMPLRE